MCILLSHLSFHSLQWMKCRLNHFSSRPNIAWRSIQEFTITTTRVSRTNSNCEPDAKTIRMPNCDPVWVHVRRRLSFFHLCTHVRLHSRRTLATATNERRGYRISHSRLGIRPTVYTSHTAGEGERERSARALRAHAYIAVCLRAWVVSGSRTQTSQLPHTFLRFVIRFVSLLCVVS